MSSSRSGQDASPLQSTRQMLDDLDALMERMLALPVGDNEELPPLPRDVLRTPTISASLTMLDDEPALEPPPPPVQPPHSLAFSQKPKIPAPRPAPMPPAVDFADELEEAEEPDAAVDPDFGDEPILSEPELPPLLIRRPVQVVQSRPGPRLALGSLCLQPLVWVNASFDWSTGPLGPVGRLLRSRFGRALLGYAGLVSLFIAGAWFVKEHLGWPW